MEHTRSKISTIKFKINMFAIGIQVSFWYFGIFLVLYSVVTFLNKKFKINEKNHKFLRVSIFSCFAFIFSVELA